MKKRDSALARHLEHDGKSSRRGISAASQPPLALVLVASELSFPLSLSAQRALRRTRTHDGVTLLSPLPRAFFHGLVDQTNMPKVGRRVQQRILLSTRAGRA